MFLVAVDKEDQPLAFGDLEADGHFDHMFCHPDLAGSGIRSNLYDALEPAALRQGLKYLYVEASEPARRLFPAQGFRVDHRRDFIVRNVAIHNYRMEKRL